MAGSIMLHNPGNGVFRKGYYGFSWTTLFFGGYPALFRGDPVGFLVIIASILTFGLVQFIWAFFYNKSYTLRLIDKGYQLIGHEQQVLYAKSRLGISAAAPATAPRPSR